MFSQVLKSSNKYLFSSKAVFNPEKIEIRFEKANKSGFGIKSENTQFNIIKYILLLSCIQTNTRFLRKTQTEISLRKNVTWTKLGAENRIS